MRFDASTVRRDPGRVAGDPGSDAPHPLRDPRDPFSHRADALIDDSDALTDDSDAVTVPPTRHGNWSDASTDREAGPTLSCDAPREGNAPPGDVVPPLRIRPDALAVREVPGDN